MNDDLTTKLRTWLTNEGYPFELRVGRVLREAGWDVFHGQHYLDAESGKLREVDVTASFGPYVGDTKGMGMVSIHLICECKVSVGKPWVIFTSQHGDDDLRLAPHLTVGDASSNAVAYAVFTNRGKFDTLVMGSRIGHGITKAFVESRAADPTGPFAAVMGAMSATAALTNEHYSALLKGSGTTKWLSIYLPIVVVKGQLFEYYLDEANNEVLAECSRAHILTYPSGADPAPVLVQVITAEHLIEFAVGSYKEAQFMASAVLPETRKIWSEYWERAHVKA